MDYSILAVIIFGIGGYFVIAISGAFTMNKENQLKRRAEARGYDYGIYYELSSGENAYCFTHKDLYVAEKCLRQLRKAIDFTQITDWKGSVYSFKNESFEKAIGEKINRQKFKIIHQSLRFNEDMYFPKLKLRTSSPKLLQE